MSAHNPSGRLPCPLHYSNFSQPVLMTYDGEALEVEPVAVGRRIPLMVVDLGRPKDTPLMLRSLQRSFPGPPVDDVGRGVHAWLGKANRDRVGEALQALGEDPCGLCLSSRSHSSTGV